MSRFRVLPRSFFQRPAETVARDLVGRYVVRRLAGERLALRLVETEAYLGAPDRASHAWAGRRTARNESLYLAGGHAYVYLIYGLHHCLNVVTGERGAGSAVLLRAGRRGRETWPAVRGSSAGRWQWTDISTVPRCCAASCS
jgi:DNA-3-methyladenine glycosylase